MEAAYSGVLPCKSARLTSIAGCFKSSDGSKENTLSNTFYISRFSALVTFYDMLLPIGRCRVECRLPEVVLYVDIGPLVVEQRSDNADAPIE